MGLLRRNTASRRNSKHSLGRVDGDMPMGKPNGDDSKATARIDLGLQDGIKAGQTALRHLYSRVADKARRLDKERGRKMSRKREARGGRRPRCLVRRQEEEP